MPNGNNLILPGFFIIQPEKVTLIALYTISKKGNYELHKEEMSLANVLLVWYQIN